MKKYKLRKNRKLEFSDWLILMFIYLKLTNQIAWSWWWVISPFFFSVILSAIIKTALKSYYKIKDKKRQHEKDATTIV